MYIYVFNYIKLFVSDLKLLMLSLPVIIACTFMGNTVECCINEQRYAQ